MSRVNERQIELRSATGNYTTAKDYWDKRSVIPLPWSETAEIAVSSAQYVLISTSQVTGNLAVGTTSTESGGLMVAELGTAVGTASTTGITDSLGNILNEVRLRDATTHDPILTTGGYEIYGLVQCSNGVADGTAIGASGSENTQISFFYVNASGTSVLTAVNQTISFGRNKLYTERNIPTIMKVGGVIEADVIQGASYDTNQRTFTVTTAFTATEVITLSTGAGAGSGAATPVGDTVTLNASAGDFNADGNIQVYRNGVKQVKGTDIIWDSTTTFHFADVLDVDDVFSVLQLAAS